MSFTTWESLKGDPKLVRLQELTLEVGSLAEDAKLDKSLFPILADPDWIDRVVNRTSSMYTIIVIGQVSSGKSSFINSLLGRKLLVPSDKPTDGVVSVLLAAKPGEPEYAEKILATSEIERFASVDEAMHFLRQQNTEAEHQLRCREVRLYLQDPWLRNIRLINTPGLGDRLQAFEKIALQYLHEDESDLVVWTFFPDTAANSAEIGHFKDALARRYRAVVGVVTRCFEGKENDDDYDPRTDPSFVGDTGVGPWIKKNLGRYLHDVVFYDSHKVRRLVQRMRENPALQDDSVFVAQLERSGYAQLMGILDSCLGSDRERVQEARVVSVLKRCIGHAKALASVAEQAEQSLLKLADAEKDQITAWKEVEKGVIGPSRARFKDEVRGLALDRSKELVTVMGGSAADAIMANFGLLETLGRSLVSWAGICDSASDALNKKISTAVDDSIGRSQFYERIGKAMEILIREHLLGLEAELKEKWKFGEDGGGAANIPIDVGNVAGGASDILKDALSGALKGVVAAILKSLAKELEKKAAETAAKEAAVKVTQQAAAKAGGEAAKQVAQKGVGATIAKSAGLITLVLVPFDIKKLVNDFNKGRDNLAETVRTRYQSDRPIYDARLFDLLWPMADKALLKVLAEARASLKERQDTRGRYLESAQMADAAHQALNELSDRLSEYSHG